MISRKRGSASEEASKAAREVSRLERALSVTKDKKKAKKLRERIRKARDKADRLARKAEKAREKRIIREKALGPRWPKRLKKNSANVYAWLTEDMGWRGFSDGTNWDVAKEESDISSIPLSDLPDIGVVKGVWWRGIVDMSYEESLPDSPYPIPDYSSGASPIARGPGGRPSVRMVTAWHASPSVLDLTIATVIENFTSKYDGLSPSVDRIEYRATGRDRKPSR